MRVTKLSQLIPGLWSVGSDTGTTAALGTIRRSAAGYEFRGQGTATKLGRNELERVAGIRPHEWARGGFDSLDDVIAYLNAKLERAQP